MDRISTVLVIIDPYASDQPCLGKAMRIANAYGASVELLLCDTPASYAERLLRNTALNAETVNDTLHLWLDSLAQSLRAGGLEVSMSVRTVCRSKPSPWTRPYSRAFCSCKVWVASGRATADPYCFAEIKRWSKSDSAS